MQPRPRTRALGAWLPLFGVLGIGAVAGGPAAGCAQPGHHDALTGDDGTSSGGSGSGGGTSSGSATGGADAGAAVSPPAVSSTTLKALGTELFGMACSKGQTAVDWSPLRRISRVEYNNMVRDLLGDTSQPANGFPPESPMVQGAVNFQVNTYTGVSTTIVQDYLQAAETLAENVVADANRVNNYVLAGIPSCGQAHDDTCASDFISTWVNRAYRGQLDATETTGLTQIYTAVKAQFDWTTGIQAVITTVLESPRFLYVLEFGGGSPSGSVVALSQTEIAARLAFFLWRSVPDATLMADAAQGKLGTPAGVLAEAQRMLTVKSPVTNALMAEDALVDFTNQWMQLTGVQAKDAQYAAFNSSAGPLAEAMYEETRLDLSQLVLADNGSLTDLLTAPSSYLNSDLVTFYGNGTVLGGGTGVTVSDPSLTNTTFFKTQLSMRPGILTTGGVLATQAHSTLPSLVLRGKLIRENVLCDAVPAPPPNVPGAPTAPPDGGTTRDLLLSHMQKGTACPTCHKLMDPIGVGFGNFDAVGRYQADDLNGFTNGPGAQTPIDSSGTIYQAAAGEMGAPIDSTAATFTNVTDLTTQLSQASQVRECFALNELRYALGRIEKPSDACSAQQIYSAFSSSSFNIQQLLLAVTQSDAFRYQSVESAGSACQ